MQGQRCAHYATATAIFVPPATTSNRHPRVPVPVPVPIYGSKGLKFNSLVTLVSFSFIESCMVRCLATIWS